MPTALVPHEPTIREVFGDQGNTIEALRNGKLQGVFPSRIAAELFIRAAHELAYLANSRDVGAIWTVRTAYHPSITF